jgi:hypothetical protein
MNADRNTQRIVSFIRVNQRYPRLIIDSSQIQSAVAAALCRRTPNQRKGYK